MTIHQFQTDEQRQAAAIDAAEKVIERSTRNMMRYKIWRERFEKHTGVKPAGTTAYPTPKGEK